MKHVPATPLPWKATKRSMQIGVSNIWMTSNGKRVFKGDEGRHYGHTYIAVHKDVVADMDYAAHAANAYPKLVALLRSAAREVVELTDRQDGAGDRYFDLLRELGEAE